MNQTSPSPVSTQPLVLGIYTAICKAVGQKTLRVLQSPGVRHMLEAHQQLPMAVKPAISNNSGPCQVSYEPLPDNGAVQNSTMELFTVLHQQLHECSPAD